MELSEYPEGIERNKAAAQILADTGGNAPAPDLNEEDRRRRRTALDHFLGRSN